MWARFAALILLGCLTSFGCKAPEVPVSVPSFLVDKAIFRPDRRWYVWTTVTDAPYHPSAVAFIGYAEPTAKVRWAIQEDLLVGYRAYSLYWGDPNSDIGASQHTDPVMAFRIRAHLDLFNNQIVSAPRKSWAEKQYMEVDWSENLVPRGFLGANAAPQAVTYAVTNPASPEAPIITDSYIRATVHFGLSSSIDQSAWSTDQRPVCNGSSEFILCEPTEFIARREMMPVDETNDYEARDVTGAERARFGNFNKSSLYVDPTFAATEAGRRFLVGRFNLWKTSHDATGALIPVHKRELRPIAWHLSTGWPEDLIPSVRDAVDDWNGAFRDTVNSMRTLSCLKSGGGQAECDALKDPGLRVLELCPHNPAQAGDAAECGPTGVKVEVGDTRYNLLSWVKEPVDGFAAVGWWNIDPETGQIISGNAYFNGVGLTSHVAEAALGIQLMNGDRVIDDGFLSGDDVAAWINAQFKDSPFGPYPVGTLGSPLAADWTRPWASPTLPAAPIVDAPAVLARLGQMNRSWLQQTGLPAVDASSYSALQSSLSARTSVLVDRGTFSASTAEQDARVQALWGSPIEAAITTADDLVLGGQSSSVPAVGKEAAFAQATSPLRKRPELAHPEWISFEPLRTSVFDLIYASAARKYKGQPGEAVARDLLKLGMRSLVAHEMGHALGFRHNFSGSYDAFNYQPQYWVLRSDGSAGPRWRDPVTQAEIDGGELEYAYSSVMDYTPSVLERSHGLGLYDRAAVKFVYGDLIEVLNDPLAKQNASLLGQMQLWHYSGLANGVFTQGNATRGIHYTQYPALFGDLQNRSDVAANDLVDSLGLGVPLMTPDGRPAVPYRFCSDDQAGVLASCFQDDRGADPYEVGIDRIQRYYSYYWNTHFRRNRLLRDPPNVGFYTEYFQKLTATWVLNSLSVADPNLLATDDGLAATTLAVAQGFDFLADITTQPEPGKYALLARPGSVKQYGWQGYGTGSAFDVPLGEGRFFSTSLEDPSSGLDWASRIRWWGAVFDKRAAVDALTTSVAALPNSTTAPDPRGLVASYAVVYPDQTEGLLGAALAQDVEQTGPVTDLAQKALVRRRWTTGTGPWAPAPGTALDPSIGFNIRNYLQTVAFARLAAPVKGALIDSLRITVVGAGDDFTTAQPTVSFADPSSGKTYRALSKLKGGAEAGMAARMIGRANQLLAASNDLLLTAAQRAEAADDLAAYSRELELLRVQAQLYDRAGH
jgi:hypothetical protein